VDGQFEPVSEKLLNHLFELLVELVAAQRFHLLVDCGIDLRLDVEGHGVEPGRDTEDLRACNFVGVILNDRFQRDIRRCVGLAVEIRVGAGAAWLAELDGDDIEGRRFGFGSGHGRWCRDTWSSRGLGDCQASGQCCHDAEPADHQANPRTESYTLVVLCPVAT
jgi:hypothetical protein